MTPKLGLDIGPSGFRNIAFLDMGRFPFDDQERVFRFHYAARGRDNTATVVRLLFPSYDAMVFGYLKYNTRILFTKNNEIKTIVAGAWN